MEITKPNKQKHAWTNTPKANRAQNECKHQSQVWLPCMMSHGKY